MHILYYRGQPIAVAERWQRLCMEMARYERAECQKHLRIKAGCPNKTVRVLK